MIPCNHKYELGRALNEMDDAQRVADTRERAVASRKVELLADRGTCYPWTMNNIFEALANLSLGDQVMNATYIATAQELPHNPVAQERCSAQVRKSIAEYWDGVAESIAQKELP